MKSLYARFLLHFLPLVAAIIVIALLVSEYLIYQSGKEALGRKLDGLTATQSLIMAEPLRRGDLDALRVLIATIIADPDIEGVHLYGEGGQLVDSYGVDSDEPDMIRRSAEINFVDDDKVLTIGRLDIGSSDEGLIEAAKRRIIFEAATLLICLVAALAASARAYSMSFRGALLQMREAFDSSGAGCQASVKWHNSAGDIGRLIAAFNDMQRRQGEYDASLKEYQASLEFRVAERTDELEEEVEKHRATQAALVREKRLMGVTLESIRDAVVSVNEEGRIQFVNAAARELLDTPEELTGQRLSTLVTLETEAGEALSPNPIEQCLSDSSFDSDRRHAVLCTPNGERTTIQYSVAPLQEDNRAATGAVFVFVDATVSRKLTRELEYHASHDDVTELINRRQFELTLKEAVEDIPAKSPGHWLCYLDLDQFKVVNDTCGHSAGDRLLRQLADLLTDRVRRSDDVARLGGDEFALLLRDCPQPVAQRIVDGVVDSIISHGFQWEGQVFKVGCSVGMVAIDSAADADDALRHADTACYLAKEKGGNRVHIHREGESEVAARQGQMSWVARINSALEQDRFVLYAQRIQIVEPSPEEPAYYEILVRMLAEDGTVIPPGAFMPAAERFKLAPRVDEWVLENALKALTENPDLPIRLAVNMSGQSLTDAHLVERIVEHVDAGHVRADQLCIEITETAMITNIGEAMPLLNRLKQIGVRIALDDFGSGISSFSYLQQLPVDLIKIDGCFVRNCLEDPVNLAIVRCLKEIGDVIDKQLVAEFVENEEIVLKMEEIGIHYVQGYGVAKPEPLASSLEAIKSAAAH